MLDVAQAPYPGDATPLEGRSLIPAFNDSPIEREGLYWEHEGNRAVRVGDWKLVAKHAKPWELYDLSVDRIEANNLAEKYPERVEQLRKQYRAYADRSNVFPWPPTKKGE